MRIEDKGEVWPPQKIDPMPGKIPGPISTWPQIDHSARWEGFGRPGKEDSLICHIHVMREWSVIFRLLIEKENMIKHPELLVTGNIGDWW